MEKKDAAMSFWKVRCRLWTQLREREIVDPEKVSGWDFYGHRRRGRVFECFDLGEGRAGFLGGAQS